MNIKMNPCLQLIFRSPEPWLKWAFLIKMCPLSVVAILIVNVGFNVSHFHLQNHKANFNQTWHKATFSWVKGIQVCSNEGPRPSPRGDDYKIAKIKKSSSTETLSQFQPNLAQCIIGWRGFRFVQIKGHALSQKEIITK